MPFRIIREDIARVAADAVVMTANPEPVCGGGSDLSIYLAAGMEKLLAARRKIGRIEPGYAAATPAFDLPAKCIIHTVGPVWKGGIFGERETLRACYERSLELAEDLECASIAFPLISAGTYGFPKEEALPLAVEVFSRFLADHDMDITLAVYDRRSYELSGKIFTDVRDFLSDRMEEAAIQGPSCANMPAPSVWERMEQYSAYGNRKETGISPAPAVGVSDMDELPDETAKRRRRQALRRRQEASAKPSIEPVYDADSLDMGRPTTAPAEAPKAAAGTASSMRKDSIWKKPKAKPRTLDDIIAQASETFQECLLRLIDQKGFTDTEVYKRANLDRKLFSKIRSNRDYQPKKVTALALALALYLNLDETKDLLARAGYALSPSSRSDLIIEFCITHGEYDLYNINTILFEYDEAQIGA